MITLSGLSALTSLKTLSIPKILLFFPTIAVIVASGDKYLEICLFLHWALLTNQRDDHQGSVHPVPVVLEVCRLSKNIAVCDGFENHLNCKDDGEDVVGIAEELPLERPGRDVWSLHGKCDAVGGDEDEDDEVKPV